MYVHSVAQKFWSQVRFLKSVTGDWRAVFSKDALVRDWELLWDTRQDNACRRKGKKKLNAFFFIEFEEIPIAEHSFPNDFQMLLKWIHGIASCVCITIYSLIWNSFSIHLRMDWGSRRFLLPVLLSWWCLFSSCSSSLSEEREPVYVKLILRFWNGTSIRIASDRNHKSSFILGTSF